MIKLDLKAESPELEALKSYLEENVSQILADKINKGVPIQKDGKTLINKKTLDTFMNYAHDEAKKLAAKGAKYACIKSDIVFGWAIHYFEEDSIEGTLFNEDGTPYKSAPKTTPKPVKSAPATVIAKPTKPETKQFTLFDLVTDPTPKAEDKPPKDTDDTEKQDQTPTFDVDMETGEILTSQPVEKQKGTSVYQQYLAHKAKYPDHILAYRLGDFYEIFGDDAIKVSRFINLTLTGRDCGVDGRVAMVGFPYHASDSYFFKITERYPLAIVDFDKISVMPLIENNDDDEDDELSEEEMREFDGDYDEEIPVANTTVDDDDDLPSVEYMKYIDKDAFMVLVELLDDKLDVQ